MDPLWSDGSPIQPVYFRHCLLYCIFNIQMLHSPGFFFFFFCTGAQSSSHSRPQWRCRLVSAQRGIILKCLVVLCMLQLAS